MRIALCAAVFVLAGANVASAATVDFESFPEGSLGSAVTIGQFTFSSPVELYIGQYFTPTGPTKALCSRSPGTFGCESDLTVTFASAIAGFSVLVDGANTTAATMTALALLDDGSTKSIIFDGFAPLTPKTLQFAEAQGIRSVTFSTTDPQGFSFDDFTIVAGGVPEPATWAMLISGFGLAGATLRRRRSQAMFL